MQRSLILKIKERMDARNELAIIVAAAGPLAAAATIRDHSVFYAPPLSLPKDPLNALGDINENYQSTSGHNAHVA
jgi:hypothetical protein